MPSSPAKPPRTRKSLAADPQQQLSLLFNEGPETVVVPVPLRPVPEPKSATPANDAETLALQLEQHPDYRVLRRLVPQLQFAAAPALGVKRLLVLDTETTGLEHSRDKIIELALLRVDIDIATGLPCGPVQVYDGLEDPGQPIPDIARKITGIDDSMVAGQALDEVRIAELLDGVDLVVAHNAGFDRPFVEARLPAFAAKAWACSFADIDWKQEGRDSAKLTALALDLGLFYDAHRAEMDCHALLAVLQAALPVAGHTGLAHLLAATEGTRYRLQATGAPFDAKDALKERGYRWDAAHKVWHTRLTDEAALQLECDWLAVAVYSGRAARVQVEALDAHVRYANRPGILSWKSLG
ncbi:MAG: 3'-5' exonuclease [Rhodoferax sp.]|uniref:3'-5' exonuclease n=1 Tax=Rhodoferax sp. TaxID=50421 RepID=UPI0032631CB5